MRQTLKLNQVSRGLFILLNQPMKRVAALRGR